MMYKSNKFKRFKRHLLWLSEEPYRTVCYVNGVESVAWEIWLWQQCEYFRLNPRPRSPIRCVATAPEYLIGRRISFKCVVVATRSVSSLPLPVSVIRGYFVKAHKRLKKKKKGFYYMFTYHRIKRSESKSKYFIFNPWGKMFLSRCSLQA